MRRCCGRRPRAIRLLAAAGALLPALLAAPARAHDVRPAYLELRQVEGDEWQVLWKVPIRKELSGGLTPVFPPGCRDLTAREWKREENAFQQTFDVECEGGLAGERIGAEGEGLSVVGVLVRVLPLEGPAQVAQLTTDAPYVTVAARPSRGRAAVTYLRLGVDHILTGVDHLLFVLGLLLLVRGVRPLVKTITSFTVAHSITLAAATLGYASMSIPPVEACISLSILLLGVEIVRARRGETSLTFRHPWTVAFAFGLLHGFGFASGLASIGLPEEDIPLVLLLFNVGVELGQLAFVFAVLLVARSFRSVEARWTRWAQAAATYAVGGLGAYWTIQRTAVILGWVGR